MATPLENQFSMIAGLESMTSMNSLGSTQITLRVRPRPQPRRRGGGRAGGDHAGVTPAAARHADAADVHQGEPGGSADALSGARPRRRLPLWTLDEYARDPHRAAHLAWSTASRRCRCSAAQKYAVHVQLDPHALAAAADRHQRSRNRAAELEREPADRHASSARSEPSRCRRPAS